MSKNIKTVPTKDFEEVVATVTKYVEGLRVGNIASLSQAFHKDAVMYGITNGEVLGGPINNLYNFVEKNGTAPDIKTRLDVLAITPTTAVVRVDMEKDAIGADYTDFHTLIKLDGTWHIIAKVYHMYEKKWPVGRHIAIRKEMFREKKCEKTFFCYTEAVIEESM